MENKQILVTRSSMPSFEDYIREISDIWDTHWLTNMGKKHQQLESELSEYLGVKNTVLFTNGHAALECILEVLELQGEVITTPFTFVSTTNAIVRKGLTPVFCDINPDDYTIDADKIESLITPRTCAIMPVHVYGNVCDVEKIEKIARRHSLKVIYDAAHAFGVKKDGIGIGNFGDVSMLSFHATKVFNTIEGGAAVFKDDVLREKFNQWKNFGITDPENVRYIGGNAKMNEFCAAMGICNLRNIDKAIEKRKKITERYDQRLGGFDGIKLNKIKAGVESNYAYYPISVDYKVAGFTRNDVFDELAKYNIHARKYFYPITNTMECFHGRFSALDTPNALKISKEILTLPIYEELELEDVDRICDIIIGVKKG